MQQEYEIELRYMSGVDVVGKYIDIIRVTEGQGKREVSGEQIKEYVKQGYKEMGVSMKLYTYLPDMIHIIKESLMSYSWLINGEWREVESLGINEGADYNAVAFYARLVS